MKKIKKALALVLALAMIATVVPVASTEAASTAKLSATTATIAVGSKKVITLTTPSTWKKVKTSWKVGKKSVAQIVAVTKKASVRAQAAGETNVKVKVTYAKSNKKGAKRYSKSLYCKVTVKNYLFKSVKQTEKNKLEATITGDTSAIKASDFVITNTNSQANIAVKGITVDATDKTKVTIETYVAMNDGKDYTVVFDGTTKSFTATNGKIASIAVTPATVAVPTPVVEAGKTNPNTVTVTYTDANGVVVGSTDVDKKDVPDGYSWLEVSVDATNNGYLSGAVLNLYKAGNTAKVKVVLHSGKYENGQEVGNLTAEATITGIDATATVTGWNVKTVKAAVSSPSTTSFKDVKETKVAVGDDIVAYIQKATSDNKTGVATGYTFESSNKDIMTVDSSAADLKDATGISVKAYKEGNAYIIVSKDKNVVTTIPVSIGAKRKAVSLALNKNAFSFSSVTVDNVTVKLTVKDQYSEDYTINASDVACVDAKDSSKKFSASTDTDGKITITIPSTEFATDKDGSYAYNVSYSDLKTTFVVTVKKADTAIANYDLSLSATSADAIIKKDSSNTTITANVYGYDKNGNIAKKGLSFEEFKLSKDGKDVTEDASGTLEKTGVININDVSKGTQMATGTYVLNVTVIIDDQPSKFSKTFTVANSQPAVSVSREKDTGKTFSECFEFKYENVKQTNVEYYGSDDTKLDDSTNGSYHVAYAKVTVTLGTAKVVVKTPVGLTVTIAK